MTLPPPPQAKPSSPKSTASPFAVAKAGKPVGKFLLYAQAGFGKTSAVAYVPGCSIITAAGETGYQHLVNAGRAPAIPNVHAETWTDALAAVRYVADNPGDTRMLSLDAFGSFDELAAQHVCSTQFGGDWGERGYASFGKGDAATTRAWVEMLAALDRVVSVGIDVVLLGHSEVRTFSNPKGSDYDRFEFNGRKKSIAVVTKWASDILFGEFYSEISRDGPKNKATANSAIRIIHAEERPSFLAKSQSGLPATIDIPNDPAQAWSTIASHIKGTSA